MTYLFGITGSVAVGKSTFSKSLKYFLCKKNPSLSVQTICTDGFLYPNEKLIQKGLLQKKGFPETYDMLALINFLTSIKQGRGNLKAPIYDHAHYDVLSHQFMIIDNPDILIIEGLNILSPAIIDFFDFTIYLDLDEQTLENRYIKRFLGFCEAARNDPKAYFYRYRDWGQVALIERAHILWTTVNLPNLQQNILPLKHRANQIIRASRSQKDIGYFDEFNRICEKALKSIVISEQSS